MQIFLHTSNGIALTEELSDATTIGDLIAQTSIARAAAWAEDAEEPLDAASAATAIGDKGHIHITRCRQINVVVYYAGKQNERKFAPGATIQAVRRWAIGPDGFGLPETQRPKQEVGVCGTGVLAERDDHVGTLATDCSLCLDLAPKDRFQG